MDEVAAYPMHKWLAVGHLVEAEAECPGPCPCPGSTHIRDVRLAYMSGTEVDMLALIEALTEEMDDEHAAATTPK